MGRRSAGAAKSAVPVGLPHDGPIFLAATTFSSVAKDSAAVLIDDCAQLLLEAAKKQPINGHDAIQDLLFQLQTATHVHEQLQTLQRCRSQWASSSSQSATTQQKKQQPSNPQQRENQVKRPLLLLYRILLEWMLSIHTPTPMRRAISSFLGGVEQRLAHTETMVDGDDVDDGAAPSKEHEEDSSLMVIVVVLQSILDSSSCWKDSLHSLQELLLWLSPNHDLSWGVLNVVSPAQILAFLQKKSQELLRADANGASTASSTNNSTETVAKLIDKTILLHLQLNQQRSKNNEDNLVQHQLDSVVVNDLREFLWQSLPAVNANQLLSLGVALGRTLQSSCCDEQDNNEDLLALLQVSRKRATLLSSDLQRAAVLQGLVMVVPITTSVNNNNANNDDKNITMMEELMNDCQLLVERATDPEIRLLALKGIRALMSRINAVLDGSNSNDETIHCLVQQRMAPATLATILQAWENPQTRKLANAVPALFESLVRLVLKQRRLYPNDSSGNFFAQLVERLLAQPPHRKGRYLALETLLPITGARALLGPSPNQQKQDGCVESPSSSCSTRLIRDLMNGMGDQGHNTGVIADLWSKILQQLLVEMSIKDSDMGSKEEEESDKSHSSSNREIPEEWTNIWVPTLASALVSIDLSRRRRVAAFCLPRIASVIGGASEKIPKRSELAHLFGALLHQIENFRLLSPIAVGTSATVLSKSRETFDDRILWAELEIIRYAAQYGLPTSKLSDSSQSENVFYSIVAKVLPYERLRFGLVHSSPTIRVAAMQVMGSAIATYNCELSSVANASFESIKLELQLWKYALPFAVKTDGKEYISSVLLCLIAFLDRLSLVEATNCGTRKGALESNPSLPMLHSFIADFLVGDLFVMQTAYPGTVACKEAFALALLECVLVFASRNHPLALDSKLLQKTSPIYNRKRLDAEEETSLNVHKALLDREVIGSLFSLLHSNWDHTRPMCFRLLAGLVVLSRVSTIPLPTEISAAWARRNIESRALFLASSPRQREADTGARILAFLYLSAPSGDKRHFLGGLVDLLDCRLTAMKEKLSDLLSDKASILGGRQLPLAHGIVQALRVILEEDQHVLLIDDDSTQGLVAIFDRTATYLCRALKVSLAVVADMKDGEEMEGLDTEIGAGTDYTVTSKAIVNPSAIGANGIFSSIHRSSKEEVVRRQASQRIVVGSWLLTKETCLALATLITQPGYVADAEVRDEAGMLLINTLTSLKHTGAAFAAHRAIQQIAKSCFLAGERDSALRQLPKQWAGRFLREVSEKEKIRDSTLRRSLGYSLGFVALQRAEISSCPAREHPLSRFLLSELVKMALPPRREVYAFSSKIALGKEMMNRLFTLLLDGRTFEFLVDESLEPRTRVHALNALRHIFLDASLSQEISPFVGLAIIASVIGYTDGEWSIRNSSTMLFAAAMLRSIDADKNATNKDTTSSKAISLQELFQAYPALDSFLLAVLKYGVKDYVVEAQGLSLPPFLPILLLLGRVQSVSLSGRDSAILAEPFVPTILECIKHRNLSVRKAAARALRNLASDDPSSATSIASIMEQCQREVSFVATHGRTSDLWNSLHGSLLSIQELAAHSEKAATMVRKSTTLRDLLRISKVRKDSAILVPPPCISSTINILSLVGAERIKLLEACFGVIFWCESRAARHMDQIGGAGLAATAALVGAKQIAQSLWNDPSSSFKVHLMQLDSLFNSSVLDIRLAAVKAFKKSIYEGLDRISTQDTEHGLIAALMKVLLKALAHELARDSDGTEVGAHPPTLRRISRCLIETIDKLLQIGTHHADREFNEELRKVAGTILRRGHASQTILDGNSIELLSFGFAQHPEHDDKYLLFHNLTQMSVPYCDWRIRHSAAVALEISKALSSAVSENSLSLWQSWALLMQDDDIDVRYAAARACSEQPNQLLHRSVTEFTLIDRYGRVCDIIPKDKCLATLFAELYKPSENLGGILNTVVDEYMQSQDVSNKMSRALLNIESPKRIFLEEPPNAYQEKALCGQVAAIEIARRGFSLEHDFSTISSQILACTSQVLSTILSRAKNADMLHDVTRHNTIFPSLHNLLLGAIGSILLLGDGNYDKDNISSVQRLASDIIGESEITGGATSRVSFMHPCILKAIKTLAFAKHGNERTFEALRNCCFLMCNIPDDTLTKTASISERKNFRSFEQKLACF